MNPPVKHLHQLNHQQVSPAALQLQRLSATYCTELCWSSLHRTPTLPPPPGSALYSSSLCVPPSSSPRWGSTGGLVIGFSAALSLRLPEMSDRWRPLVYIPCICCKALIYLIREMCGEGGGACRSRTEHFIMSVKQWERCAALVEARGGRASES